MTVAWATPEVQDVVDVELPAGATVGDAVARSGLVEAWQLDRAALAYAVHGRRSAASTPLADGDRVELLRPLVADPRDARRRRARRASAIQATPRIRRR